MKRRIITSAFLLMMSAACFLQAGDLTKDSGPACTNVPGLDFPRVDTESRAMFRVEAPDAQKVQVDILKVYDMIKDTAGVWTATTDPLPPGFHYYYLMIDGYRFADPASETFFGVGRRMSGIEIPAPDQAFYSPRIIPFVEKAFRVLTDRENRAMAGLSRGGSQTFQTVLNHPEQFSFMGGFSGAGIFQPDTELKTVYNGVFGDPESLNKKIHVLFLGIGTEEGQRMKGLSDTLKNAGSNNTYYESQGTAHEWHTWRRCLYEFAPLLFNQ